MKRNKTEQLFGVPPEAMIQTIAFDLKTKDCFTVHKCSKKGQNSFRITKSLLESLLKTNKIIQKTPRLVITILDGSDEYTLTCSLTKNKR